MISHGQNYEVNGLDQVIFPYPEDNAQRKNIEKLLNHLERGVILRMAPDGLYAKRLCQSRIYWDGPLALCSDRPNKLEREQTSKLFDTQQFLAGNSQPRLHTVFANVTSLLSGRFQSRSFFSLQQPAKSSMGRCRRSTGIWS